MATKAPSMKEYLDLGIAEAKAQRPELTFQANDVSTMEQEGAAAMAEHLTAYAIKKFRDKFLDGATGDALTEYCDDTYGIQRNQAISAAGKITFTRASSANGAQTLLAGFVVATLKDASGKDRQYVLEADVSWGAAETGDKTVDLVAILPGKDGNIILPNKIVRMVSASPDPAIVILSSTALAGGDDEEGDDDLRARCRAIFETLARATLDAIEAGVLKEVPEVKRASVVEDSTGLMTLYVSDINGNTNDRMLANVREAMGRWRPGGSMMSIMKGVPQLQPIVISLLVSAPSSLSPTLVANVKLAIVAAVSKLKIGENLYRSLIQAAAKSVDPDNIKNVNVITPATDVAADANQLIRTTLADISIA